MPVIEGHMVCNDEIHLNIEKVHRLRSQSRVRHHASAAIPGSDRQSDGVAQTGLGGEETYDISLRNQVVGEDAGLSHIRMLLLAGTSGFTHSSGGGGRMGNS